MYGQPAYGAPPPYGQPAYGYAPPPPPPAYYPPPQQAQQGPLIINLGNQGSDSGSPCPTCGKDTGQIPRKTIGCVAIAWCLCLFLTTGSFWCYPLCSDGCKDTELICVKCQTVKSKIPANCC